MSNSGALNENFEKVILNNASEFSSIDGNLLKVSANGGMKTMLVTSANQGEGKTVTAAAMAYTLANQIDSKVVLIDGNLHSPKVHELFSIDLEPGLSDLLLANLSFTDVISKTEYNDLTIIPRGSSRMDKFGVQEAGILKEVLQSLRDNFTYIIMDGHYVFGSSDISLIAKYFDGVIFVIESEKTRWEVVQRAKDTIMNVDGNILGAVLNKRRYYIPGSLYGKF